MAEEVPQFFFDHQEVVEDLIKRQGLHSGLWGLSVEIGLVGSNMNVLDKNGKSKLTPAGVVLMSRIGIRQVSEPTDLTVDAAEVNPRQVEKKTTRRPPKAKKK